MTAAHGLVDSFGRAIGDLRISVTDRCNFHCLYCLPDTQEGDLRSGSRAGAASFKHTRSALLSFEEIERVARISVRMGVRKLRLTGGEPLLRRNIEALVEKLAAIEGVEDLALTTNGFLFASRAAALKRAGLTRVSLSIDSLNEENFKRITGMNGLSRVFESIDAAEAAGLKPVKLNCVVIRGLNDHELEPLAGFARERGLTMRFIEYMPLDAGRGWSMEQVVPVQEIQQRLAAAFRIRPADRTHPSETALRWVFEDGPGEIGVIAPVTQPFCSQCNRMRLTADGKIRTCLFSLSEHDLRELLRSGADDEALARELGRIVLGKEAGHRIGREDFAQPARSMSCIGG